MAAVIGSWPAHDFNLIGLDGLAFALSAQSGRTVVRNFWSAECPWSRRADALLMDRWPSWARQGVALWGIASNASEPEIQIRAEVAGRRIPFPILLDHGRVVADRYGAVATPHLYLIDAAGIMRYAGAFDE